MGAVTSAGFAQIAPAAGPKTKNRPPTAVAIANPTSGTVPLAVSFDGSRSSDPNPGDTLSYSWDLNGDGVYDDSTAQSPTFVYANAGTYTARLKVTDGRRLSSIS